MNIKLEFACAGVLMAVEMVNGGFGLINRPISPRSLDVCSVGQYRNGVRLARAKTSSSALHKSMINSRAVSQGFAACGVFHVSNATNVNVANIVIYYSGHVLNRNVQKYSGNN